MLFTEVMLPNLDFFLKTIIESMFGTNTYTKVEITEEVSQAVKQDIV